MFLVSVSSVSVSDPNLKTSLSPLGLENIMEGLGLGPQRLVYIPAVDS